MNARSAIVVFALVAGLALASGLARAAAQAAGAESPEPKNVLESVSLNDLDLGERAGAAAALDRIESAARRLCAPTADIDAGRLNRACVQTALDQGVATLDRRLVTRIYEITKRNNNAYRW